MPTYTPHWTSGDSTYVQEPPDQLSSRGYIADDVPTHNETNWVYRTFMPFRAYASEAEAAELMLEGQFGVICGSEAPRRTALHSYVSATGSSTAFIATNGKDVCIVRSDGAGNTIGSLLSYSSAGFALTASLASVAYDGVADVAMDETIIVAVCSSGNRVIAWSAVDGTLITSIAITGARRVCIHGRVVVVGTSAGVVYGYKRDLSAEWWSGTTVNHNDVINGIAAHGQYVLVSGDATAGGGDTAAGTNAFLLNAEDGALLGEVSLNTADDMGPCVYADGHWYVFGDSKLHRVRLTADVAPAPVEVTSLTFTGGSSNPQVCSNGRSLVCTNYGFDARSLSYIGTVGPSVVTTSTALSLNTLFSWYPGGETLYAHPAPIPRTNLVQRRASVASITGAVDVEFPNLLLQPLQF